MRWCAYDSDFTPNKIDGRFKTWITKGLTAYHSFVHKVVLNRVKYMAGVLLEKYNKNDTRAEGTLVGGSVDPMEPTTFIFFGAAK